MIFIQEINQISKDRDWIISLL